MSVKRKVVKKIHQWVDKAADLSTQRRIKEEVTKRLKQGKEAILRVQKELTKPENRARAMGQVKRANAALAHLKKEAIRRERQAMAYAKKNPEKALVVAVAAGAAAGALLLALKRRARA